MAPPLVLVVHVCVVRVCVLLARVWFVTQFISSFCALVVLMADFIPYVTNAMPERSLRRLFQKVVLAERFRLKFAACGCLSIDFIASISDTLTGLYSVMEALMGWRATRQVRVSCIFGSSLEEVRGHL